MSKLNLVALIDDSDADNCFHEIIIRRSKIPLSLRSLEGSIEGIDYLRHSLSLADNSDYPMPQLIFLDINMPGLNGFEMLDKFRQAPDPYDRKRDLKIFMLTGSVNPDDRARAKERYADIITGFCLKPLELNAFTDIVKEYFPD